MRELYERVTNRIVHELEQGAVPWTRPWKRTRTGSIMPHNRVTGRSYHGINIAILWGEAEICHYNTHEWLTYQQAKEAGGQVKKGEKSTQVVFTKKIMVKEDEDTKSISMLRTYNVFNADQIEGLKPLEPLPDMPPDTRYAHVEELLQKVTVKFGGGDQPCYVPSLDFVHMPIRASFETQEHYYATLLHESAHWTGAKARLDRDLRNRFGTRAYAAEELVAELGAAFLCAELGVEGELRHAGYIASWVDLLKHDPRAIFTAAAKASQAADYIRFPSEADEIKKTA